MSNNHGFIIIVSLLIITILLSPAAFGSKATGDHSVWAKGLETASAAPAKTGSVNVDGGKISRLLKKAGLLCSNSTTLSDGSTDYDFLFMLMAHVSGLIAVVFIFFGKSIISALKKRVTAISSMIARLHKVLRGRAQFLKKRVKTPL